MAILPQTITAQSINWCKVYFENCKDRNGNLLNLKIISYMKKINNFWSVVMFQLALLHDGCKIKKYKKRDILHDRNQLYWIICISSHDN